MNLRPALGCLLVAFSSSACAWIDTGHMIVATIARRELKPSVSKEVDRLLAIDAPANANDFITAACWADDIRRDRPATGPWHYIDHHFRTDGKPTTNQPDPENVVTAIARFSTILRDRSKPDADRAEALRFLIHFIGDIHQPLHGSDRDSDAHPTGDRGGNQFRILPPPSLAGLPRPPQNLHTLWDFGGGLFHGEPRPLSPESLAQLNSLTATITREHPRRSFRELRAKNAMDWSLESLAVARDSVYQLTESQVPSDAYIKQAQEISAKRIALAGYRLADTLNNLLGK